MAMSYSLHLQTAKLLCSLIPAALQNEQIFLSIDEMTVPKFGKKFDAGSLLHDPACHTGTPYVKGRCFISLPLIIPVLSHSEEEALFTCYPAIPAGYRLQTKERNKLELAGDFVKKVIPLLKGRQVLLFFNRWYAKSALTERFLQYPLLNLICNVHSDSTMHKLPSFA